jgi:hypothetical protein
MMMKMLQAGGMAVLTDRARAADEDNPKGYYEFERVKRLPEDTAWLPDAQGKAVKVISALLPKLPPAFVYKIIFMRRNIQEILNSQKQMLIRRGEPTDTISDQRLISAFQHHLEFVRNWVAGQPNITVLYTDYDAILKDPFSSSQSINRFLGASLDTEKMAKIVDSALYRQRH